MKIQRIAHLSFNVSNMEESIKFYCGGLGFKQKFILKYEAIIDYMKERIRENGGLTPERESELEALRDKPWLTYLEIVPMQFIELFYPNGPKEAQLGDDGKIGYLHLSLEVDDIKRAREELLAKGIIPTSEISLGADNTYQMWLKDPDGNRIELMEYTAESMQRIGKMD